MIGAAGLDRIRRRLALPPWEREFAELAARHRVVIFGAGAAGRNLQELLRRKQVAVDAFGDNDPRKWGTTIAGVRVGSPDELQREDVVLVASIAHREIVAQLRARGARHVFDRYLDLKHPPDGILENLDAIASLLPLLADERSRYVFRKLIAMRLFPGSFFLNDLHSADEYVPRDVPGYAPAEPDPVIIDGGAYHGETAQLFLEWFAGAGIRIHSFEPSPASFRALVANLARQRRGDRVTPWPLGLSDRARRAKFDSSGGTASRIVAGTERHDGEVECVALDEHLRGERVSLIKLDIEGEELAALRGAEQTIRRHRPRLAVCLYHRPEDLWTIPLLLKSWVPDYRLYLRHHSPDSTLDTVAYAVA